MKKEQSTARVSLQQDEKLTEFFNRYFSSADKRVVRTLVILILSILRSRTVKLGELALCYAAPLKVKRASLERRFQRFFTFSLLSASRVGAIVIALLSPGPVIISIDRTNWKFGKKHINLLVAGVYFQNVCLPIAWVVLPASTKRGNSKTLHRKRVIDQVLKLLPAERIEAIVGDREFIGTKWISYLNKKNIPFVLRIRKTISIDGVSAKEAIRRRLLTPAKRKNRKFRVCGVDVYVCVKTLRKKKQKDGTRKAEKLILISNVYAKDKQMLAYYRQRESIEHLFSNWKKRGFNFESTHMTDKKKLEQWIGLLTICVCISMLWGKKRFEEKEIRVKGHGFRAKSLFRYGLDDIREMLFHYTERVAEWKHFLRFILKHLENANYTNTIYVG